MRPERNANQSNQHYQYGRERMAIFADVSLLVRAAQAASIARGDDLGQVCPDAP